MRAAEVRTGLARLLLARRLGPGASALPFRVAAVTDRTCVVR
jgi:hypothetical protein